MRHVKATQQNSFIDLLITKKYLYDLDGTFGYGGPFLEEMQRCSNIIGSCAGRLFPEIQTVALPTRLPLGIANAVHLTHTIPDTLVFISTANEEEKANTNQSFDNTPDIKLNGSQHRDFLKHSACLPLYPLLRNTVVNGSGSAYLVDGLCFRNESDQELLSFHLGEFHMKELVFVGTESYCKKAMRIAESIWDELSESLGFQYLAEPAFDSFCPSCESTLTGFQKMVLSKTEYRIPLFDQVKFLTCGSSNMHRTTFSKPFNIRLNDGSLSCTSCLAFGLERICFACLAAKLS